MHVTAASGFQVTPQKSAPPPLRWWTEHAEQAFLIGLLLMRQKRPHPLCLRMIRHGRHGNRLTATVSEARPRSESHVPMFVGGASSRFYSVPLRALSPAHNPITADLDLLDKLGCSGLALLASIVVLGGRAHRGRFYLRPFPFVSR